MSDRVDIPQLRAAEQAATPGPWKLDPHNHVSLGCRCMSCHDDATVWQTTNGMFCDDVPRVADPAGQLPERCEQHGYKYEDADLIALARNALPALLDAAERAERLRSGVERIIADLRWLEGSLPSVIANDLAAVLDGEGQPA